MTPEEAIAIIDRTLTLVEKTKLDPEKKRAALDDLLDLRNYVQLQCDIDPVDDEEEIPL